MTRDPLLNIAGGPILMRDEGARRNWQVNVKSFLLSPNLVTRGAYARSASKLPITDVSWIDAITFCNSLSSEDGLTPCYSGLGSPDAESVVCDFEATGYRLPTEAEWEFACRAGSNDVRYGDLDAIAWYRNNSDERLHDVGTKQPNPWGLYDMLGNVWEWCWDLYDPKIYGPYRVFRGGGFADPPRGCRASCRRKSHPTFRIEDVGFRLARSISKPLG